jgi:hypothetical protein
MKPLMRLGLAGILGLTLKAGIAWADEAATPGYENVDRADLTVVPEPPDQPAATGSGMREPEADGVVPSHRPARTGTADIADSRVREPSREQ